MRQIQNFDTFEQFKVDNNGYDLFTTPPPLPRVVLIKNAYGNNKLLYIDFIFIPLNNTSRLNGSNGNQISFLDIPVKNTIEDLKNDKMYRVIYFLDYVTIPPIKSGELTNIIPYLKVTPNALELYEGDNLVSKFTLTGLKRKDSEQRDFIGEIACYLDYENSPFLYKVDRSNPDNPTVTKVSWDDYKDTYEMEKRTKATIIHFDHL